MAALALTHVDFNALLFFGKDVERAISEDDTGPQLGGAKRLCSGETLSAAIRQQARATPRKDAHFSSSFLSCGSACAADCTALAGEPPARRKNMHEGHFESDYCQWSADTADRVSSERDRNVLNRRAYLVAKHEFSHDKSGQKRNVLQKERAKDAARNAYFDGCRASRGGARTALQP